MISCGDLHHVGFDTPIRATQPTSPSLSGILGLDTPRWGYSTTTLTTSEWLGLYAPRRRASRMCRGGAMLRPYGSFICSSTFPVTRRLLRSGFDTCTCTRCKCMGGSAPPTQPSLATTHDYLFFNLPNNPRIADANSSGTSSSLGDLPP
jgi:hypothetical protein